MAANPFSTPLPHPQTVHALDMSLSGLKRWSASLNLADPGTATRQLYEQLRLANGAQMPVRARMDWLEKLAGHLQTITGHLHSHFQNKPFPLSDTEMAVGKLANAMHSEMILGYRHILASHPDNSLLGRGSERQLRQLACYRLFVHAGEILSNHCAMYTEPPAGMWRHLHAYYERVRRQGWANSPLPGISPQATVEMEYRKTLLFALQPSQRVPVAEWQKIKQTIGEWLPLAPLLDARNRPRDRPLYCIRFELDMPLAAVTDRCCGACDTRMAGVLLDTKPLVETLEKRLELWERVSPSRDTQQPTMESIKTLLHSWRIPDSPRELRIPVDMPLTMVSGLENIHAFLSAESCTADTSRGVTVGKSEHKVLLSTIPEGLLLGPLDPECEIQEISYSGWESALPSPWRVPPPKLKVEPLPAQAVNVSETGYRLEMALPDNNSMRLGEPIALRGARGDNWELFVLRWVRRIDNERATLGLERIGDRLHGIDIIVQGNHESRGVLHAVAAVNEEMKPLVLIPRLPALGRKRLSIRNKETETPISLVSDLALSPVFEAFVYKFREEVVPRGRARPSARALARMSSSDPFSAVWDVL